MAFKPGFDQSPAFNAQGPNTWGGRGAGQQQAGWGQTPQQAQGGMTPEQLQYMYDRPAASTVDTDRMSYEDTIVKTLLAFGVLLVGAVAGWNLPPIVWIVGAIVGFVLALVNTFKKKPSPGLILTYAFFEGLFVGGISNFFEYNFTQTGGIVAQAVFGTLGVFAVTLLLFLSGKVRATPKATRFFLIAIVGYMAFSLVNLVLMWTGVTQSAFGLMGVTLFGIPLGVLIGIFVVVMAAYSLILDFDQIKTGVQRGAPKIYAWTAAFGLIVTLVWLYLEILRILAIVASSARN
ncbi:MULTISPECIES: Bax inhibitor-1/YccA family protein [unclassified Curtobacterium]|uniref:Bax inhibitor-1/YccA family protein n=2 Tax=Bacteria TaxID=2 RepID=UPI000DAAB1C6|nr:MULTISPECIES: Bax inhibitor-1/YccA family protein [unclassified Curtobacterium]NQW89798.1 Bax inhibitor-1/YccA family protein [Curtobacterium sp. VKM Ac-2861]ROR36968.1 putative YccA/Bax inhibitor family protein [Curtobacterium sp. JUb34]ROS37523.1 putative YccA/Bax inhibitor family protein [Curtobacterium sp. PhB78]TCL80043.1 putative YccA/Bax inhibitor family protein [Curtobacterium sp. PhB128]TCL86317.1 putative YccA/Bax inhibitor family protein [Curtobacterium sp. PhB142]